MSVFATGSPRRIALLALVSIIAVAVVPASEAWAQLPPMKNKRPVRRAVIDLEKMALETRPGQVVPEDAFPAPQEGTAAIAAAPLATLAAAGNEPVGAKQASPSTAAGSPQSRASDGGTTQTSNQPAAVPPASPQQASGQRTAAMIEEDSIPAASNGEAIRVIVLSATNADATRPQVQWRPVGGDESSWRPAGAGARAEERVELRTGLDGAVTLEIDEMFSVQVDRLSRLRIERRRRDDVSELSIELLRGRAEVRPMKVDQTGLSIEPVRIRTPDATLLRRTGVGVTFDAFKGTRETPLSQR